MKFKVLEKDGSEPDFKKIALKEDWIPRLDHDVPVGFAMLEDGALILLDYHGFTFVPEGRFDVVWSKEEQ